MIIIKNRAQIEIMRKPARIVVKAFEMLERHIKPGITTKELDKIAADYIKSRGGLPSFLGYKGFPASINTSVNNVIVHGVPDATVLKNGDIIGIDIGVFYEGYHGDAARTYGVGKISDADKKLIEVSKQSFFEGIKYAKEKNFLNQICKAIQEYVVSNGFTIMEDFIGHGIGKTLHEEPDIPNHDIKKRGPRLMKGMTFAIEPMISPGINDYYIEEDGWTARTKDGKNSAHYENTIVITDGEPEILTI